MLGRLSAREVYAAILALCLGLLAFALYLQIAQNLEPCPLCVLQRMAYIAVAAVALIGAVFAGAARSRWLPVVLALPVVAGIAVASRHVWIEHFPPKSAGCGPQDLGYLMQTVPLDKLLPTIFRGSGDCAVVLWRFLGLSIAEWSLIWLVVLLGAAGYLLLRQFRAAAR